VYIKVPIRFIVYQSANKQNFDAKVPVLFSLKYGQVMIINLGDLSRVTNQMGAWDSVVVKALRYKWEGPGIDSRCRRDFSCGI